MKKESIECLTAGCLACAIAKCAIGSSGTQEQLYTCTSFPYKHKSTFGRHCANFKCKMQNSKELCKYCIRGKKTK